MIFKHLYDNTKTLFSAFQFHYSHIATSYHTDMIQRCRCRVSSRLGGILVVRHEGKHDKAKQLCRVFCVLLSEIVIAGVIKRRRYAAQIVS